MKLFKKTYFFLLLIVIFAAVLRFIWLGNFPPSLYSDETDQGYNAYSILSTGRDEHGIFLPVSLRSFGDWKPPIPTYLMVPFIWSLGLTEVSVRLPSAVLGIGTVILAFFLTRTLFIDQKDRTRLALLSSLFLTISPWHILQSRAAMLVSVALFFLALGVYFLLSSFKKRPLIFLSSVSFVLSVYSYYGLRVIAPLILFTIFIKYRRNLLPMKKEVILSAVLGIFLLFPLFTAFIKQPDVILGRVKTVSIFYDQGINLRKWELITQDGIGADTVITRFFHNNFYLYGINVIQRFLSHFDASYLLVKGDQSPPFQIPQMGILYIPDLLFISIGLFILFKKDYSSRSLIVFWIIISIIPAAFTFVTPSSNRTFNAVIPFMILIALGIIYVMRRTRVRILTAGIISIFYILSLGYFLRQYFIILPSDHADWWNYGWKQVVEYVKSRNTRYTNIIVPNVYGMPYIYFLFYQKYPPDKFQTSAIRPYVADRFGFENVEGYGNYLFPEDFDWTSTKKYNLQKNSLYVLSVRQAPDDANYVKAIYYPNGRIAFKIFAYD